MAIDSLRDVQRAGASAFAASTPSTPVTATKPSPVDADQLIMLDSAASDAPVLVTKSQLLAEVFTMLSSMQSAIDALSGATAPAAFTVGQWTSTQGDTQIAISITALPSDGGSTITALEYTLNGSTWTAFAGTGTGSRTITGLTNGTAYPVQIRAVNGVGNGAASDTKSTTPTAAAPSSLGWVGTPTILMQYVGGASHDVAVPAGAALGDMLVMPIYHWTGEPPTSIVASNGQTLTLLAQYAPAAELGGVYGVVIAGTVPTSVTVTPTGAPNGAWTELHLARGVSAVAGTVLDGNAFAPRTALTYNTDAADALVLSLYSTPGEASGREAATFTPVGGSGTVSPIFEGIPTGVVRGVHSGATGSNDAAITWSAVDTAGGRWLSLALKA